MKKLAFAMAALSLSAGIAFAENPYVGRTDVITNGPNAGEKVWNQDMDALDMAATGSILPNDNAASVPNETREQLADPASNRYGDAEPGSVTYN